MILNIYDDLMFIPREFNSYWLKKGVSKGILEPI